MKLFSKLFLFSFATTTIVLLVSIFYLYSKVPLLYLDNQVAYFKQDVQSLVTIIKGKEQAAIEDYLNQIAKEKQYNIWLEYNQVAYEIFESPLADAALTDTSATEFSIPLQLPGENRVTTQGTEASLLDFLKTKNYAQSVVQEANFTDDDGKFGHLEVETIMGTTDSKKEIMLLLPVTFLISTSLSIFFSFLLSKYFSTRIKKIATRTHEMKRDQRLVVPDPTQKDELADLERDIKSLYLNLVKSSTRLEEKLAIINQSELDKTNFLRSASHELKTPLNSLGITLTNMQENIGEYADHAYYLGVCLQKVNAVNQMVQDILRSSALSGETQAEVREPVKVTETIEKILQDYQIVAENKGVQIVLQLPKIVINSNPELLEKALSNIISNALYYCDGEQLVQINFVNKHLQIKNTCECVNEKELAKVFQPFFRGAEQYGHYYPEGTGLGLYITKTILDNLDIPYAFVKTTGDVEFSMDFTESEIITI